MSDTIIEKISLKDRKTVYVTKKAYSVRNGVRKEGDPVTLHPKQAEAWIASGTATAEKTTGKQTKNKD